MKALQDLMAEAGFTRAALSVTLFGAVFSKTTTTSFAVGAHRYGGEPVALPASGREFTSAEPGMEQ